MDSDAASDSDSVTLASAISQARLEAFQSLAEGDYNKFLALSKECIDVHVQATKAMINDIGKRISSGENFDWPREMNGLKEGLFHYCQAIVNEAESLVPESVDKPITLSSDSSYLTRHPTSATTATRYSRLSPNFSSFSASFSSSSSGPNPSLSINMSESSGESHLLASSRQRLHLFFVSSKHWIKYSPDFGSMEVMLPEGMTPVDKSIHLGVVMGILSKLYTMAKLLQTIILSYGVEPDTSSFGLLHWVRRSEQNINSTDLVVLVETVENLYYSLYARVVIELANIELCGTFRSDRRSLRIHRPFLLPEADHLYRIILGFKDTLHSPSICPSLRKESALYFQQAYISQVVDKTKNEDSSPEDPLGYRLHAATIVSDRDGPYCTKWRALISFFNVIPSRTMALMSEKYLAITPVAVMPDDVPFDQLPFIKPTKVAKGIPDTDTVKDHRMMALAKLEGTTIGEERHKDPKSRIYHLAKQRKCVCFGICRCSKECTNDVLRDCPCAERHVRIMTVKRGLHYKWPGCAFPTTAGTMIRMYFHGLASMKRGVTNHHIAQELHRAFESIDALITAERERVKEISQENAKQSS